MRDVLRKWTPRENYVIHQNFPTHFCLSLSLECCGEISRQSAESAYPINSVKVDVFLPNSYARFSLVKVRKQLAPRLEIISPEQQDLLSVCDNRSRFPGKSIALQHDFISLSRVKFRTSTQYNGQRHQRQRQNPC